MVARVLGRVYARHGMPNERTVISRVTSALSVAFQQENKGFNPELFAAAVAREEQDAVDAAIIAREFDLARGMNMEKRDTRRDDQ